MFRGPRARPPRRGPGQFASRAVKGRFLAQLTRFRFSARANLKGGRVETPCADYEGASEGCLRARAVKKKEEPGGALQR